MKLKKIFYYYWLSARKHKRFFFLALISYAIGLVLASTFNPILFKKVVDIISGDGEKIIAGQMLINTVFLIGANILAFNIFFRIGDFAISRFQAISMRDIHNFVFARLSLLSYNFFSNNFAGGLVAKAKRFTSSFEGISDRISFDFFFAFMRLAGVFTVLFIKVPKIGFIFIGWVVIYMAITIFSVRFRIKYDLEAAENDSKVTAYFADVITNVLNLKIFSSRERERESFGAVVENDYRARMTSWNVGNYMHLYQGLMIGFLQFLTLYIMAKLWIKGEVTTGLVVLVQTYMIIIFDSLWNIGRSITRFIKDISNAKEMVDILEKKAEIVDPENPEEIRIKNGAIEFENIDFEYVDEASVFKNFSLKIKPGEKVGLVGRSGSGKSTITKMLLRFIDVKKGAILIDGQNICNITQNDLRNVISYVPQDPILFHRSIAENIAYSRPGATLDEIRGSAKKAHADEFVLKLQNGYDTMVGERGIKLSGGERQRVAIARAMLKNAPILILDEATSSLDSENEAFIQEALNELIKNKTAIIIAHRLSTVQKMDRIIVLDNGKIAEEGSHNELINRGGIYSKLWNYQTQPEV